MRKKQTFWRESIYIAKKYIIAEKYTFIAKRFNYAELYQAYGHYTSNNLTVDTTKTPWFQGIFCYSELFSFGFLLQFYIFFPVIIPP